jgi:hypothetical protein
LEEFTTAIEQLAHHADSTLTEDHIRRGAGKAFTDRVEDPAIKIQLLLGGQKALNKALRQTLELQAMPQKRVPGHSGGADRHQPGKGTKDDRQAGAVRSQANSGITAPMEGSQKIMTGAGNMLKDLRDIWELTRRSQC